MLFSDGGDKLSAEQLKLTIAYMNSFRDSFDNLDIDEDGEEDDE